MPRIKFSFQIFRFVKYFCKSGLPDMKLLSFACPKESNQSKRHPAAALSFGLSAASGRLRNSRFQHSNSPRRFPSAAQAEGAARGLKVKTTLTR
jgi:hypothetical protein